MRRIFRRYGKTSEWFWEQDRGERTSLIAEDRVLSMTGKEITKRAGEALREQTLARIARLGSGSG